MNFFSLHPQPDFENMHMLLIIAAVSAAVCFAWVIRVIWKNSDPLNRTGFELHSKYQIRSKEDDGMATIYLLRVKRECREMVRQRPGFIDEWLRALNLAFTSKEDMQDSRDSIGLPSSYALQSRFESGEVAVLDVGAPRLQDPEHKQVTWRKADELLFGDFDLLATIDRHSVRKAKSVGQGLTHAASV